MSVYNDSFELPYKVLTCLGLWNAKTRNPVLRRLYTVYQCWAFFYLTIFVNFCIWDLYFVRKDVHRASTNLSATMTVIMLLWKNTQALFKFPKLRRLQKKLGHDLKGEDQRDVQILLRASGEIKRTYLLVYAMAAGTLTCWVFSPLLNTYPEGEKKLPLPVWIPWPHQKTPYYELAFVFQGYGGYFVGFDVLSLNLTIFGTIVQICAEYNILVKNTEAITEWCKRSLGDSGHVRALDERENLKVGKLLVENIRYHQKIINYVEEAESCYVHMMLVQFGGSAVLATVVALDLILVSREFDSRLVTLIIFFSLVSVDIYLFCHYGSRLRNKSHEFLTSIYCIPWEAMNARNRKTVSIMILKAQRAPSLTVEKIVHIDFYSLLKLTKIVYNVLYLLLHLAKDR